MLKFIKVSALNPTNEENDVELYLRIDKIQTISEASVSDIKHREETKSVIGYEGGIMFGVSHTAQQILSMIEDAEKEF